ncbi:MAG: glycosyltransferase [Candidatus Omnitrophica bacterium]|nr:glycosyltransferase [Candidatus Omnitrophota bacterium]
MTVSVIVPAYNACKTIGQTLKALAQQDYAEAFEIIVVDDGSSDQTAEVIHSFANARYVHQPHAGPAAARNHGASLAKGRMLAFTDADCIPHKDWLSQLMGGFVAGDVAVVMGSYGITNSENLLAYCVYREILFRHQHLLPDFPKVFGSYNVCIQRHVFEHVGGFSTAYRYASGEDNDLSYKIIESGWRIYFERNALVDHFHPTQIGIYLKEQFRHGLWRVMLYASHPAIVTGDGYTFWKDMTEVPWSLWCLLGVFLSASGVVSFKAVVYFLVVPLLMFEIFFARPMLRNSREEFFWGFMMFLRAFSRTLGFSTGILLFLGKKISNKL